MAGMVLRCGEPAVCANSGSGQSQSIRSSVFSRGFLLLIPSDRAAPSYQLLDLSLAIRPAVFFFLVADILGFDADALLTSFLDNCLPLQTNDCLSKASLFDHLVGAAELHRRNSRVSNQLENRQHEDDLRHESAGESKGACNRNPQRVDDDVREPRPEIQRTGENRGSSGNVEVLCD
jgi:hypothetical protein